MQQVDKERIASYQLVIMMFVIRICAVIMYHTALVRICLFGDYDTAAYGDSLEFYCYHTHNRMYLS